MPANKEHYEKMCKVAYQKFREEQRATGLLREWRYGRLVRKVVCGKCGQELVVEDGMPCPACGARIGE